MSDRIKILYCSNKEKYLEILKRKDIFASLRVPNSLRDHINNIILTEQIASKRGILKYLTICYQGEVLTREQIEQAVPSLKETMYSIHTTNNYTTFSIFNNNLTYILKQTEEILNELSNRRITEPPKINISTDLDGIQGIQYLCSDISSYMDIIQLTTLNSQAGDIILGITDLPDEFISFLLISSINANGRLKIYLMCDEVDREIWKLRGIEILQRMNVNIDFSILDTIIDTI